MSKKLIIMAMLFTAPTAFAANGIYMIPGTCNCNLGTPSPDAGTREIMNLYGNPSWPGYSGNVHFETGDQVTVCNSGGCATYTYASQGQYVNGTWTKYEEHPPAKGGGGTGGGSGSGGAGSGYYPAGPGGTDAPGSGTVTVGPLLPGRNNAD